jgi:hypothetical protein
LTLACCCFTFSCCCIAFSCAGFREKYQRVNRPTATKKGNPPQPIANSADELNPGMPEEIPKENIKPNILTTIIKNAYMNSLSIAPPFDLTGGDGGGGEGGANR